MELTPQQSAELQRLKAYFPFRAIYAALHSETGAFEALAPKDKRPLRKMVAEGWQVFEAQF